MTLEIPPQELRAMVFEAIEAFVRREFAGAIAEERAEWARRFAQWVSMEEAIELTGMSERWLRDQVKAGQLTRSQGLGEKAPRIFLPDLLAKVEEKQVKSARQMKRDAEARKKVTDFPSAAPARRAG